MKKALTAVLAAIMLLTGCGAVAEAAREGALSAQINGNLADGCYTLTVAPGAEDPGEWHVDEMAEEGAAVRLEYAQTENGVFTARYAPEKDGEVTVHLRHYSEHRVCDEVHSFDLLIRDGAIQEVTGGSYTTCPPEEDLNPFFSGEWLEKDTQFTSLEVTHGNAGGWRLEIRSPLSHGGWVIRGTAYYDCDYDAFIYADGVKCDLPADDQAPEVPAASDLWGMLKFSGDAEGSPDLVWFGMEDSDNAEVVFERAPALPAYVCTGSDEIGAAVANGLAGSGLADRFLTEPGYVMIPVVSIHKTEMTEDARAKVYGSFWILNYVKRGSVLHCISGGEFAGIASLEKGEHGWRMTGLEEAGDGEDYAADLERFANGDTELLQKYQESADLDTPAQKEIRIRTIREYVESNGLGITAYQDYGWEPVSLD